MGMKMNKVTLLVIPIILSSCNLFNGDNNADLDKTMDDIINSQVSRVPPIREFLEPEQFIYSVSRSRSPFEAEQELLAAQPKFSSDIKPNQTRTQELLESVRIENIRMSGTMDDGRGDFVALSFG